jgi:phage terminase large subunit GpA-like protein
MLPEIITTYQRDAFDLFERTRAAHLRLKPKRKVSEWAEAERWIAQGASPLSEHGDIRYRLSVMPWCTAPMDSAKDPDVQVTVLWFASGLAKTEIAVNIIGHSIHEEPKNIFVAYPKDESRDKFSRDVLQRSLIDATPAVKALVSEFKSRDGGNTIAYKRFAGGSIYMVGAGSAANFRGPRAGVIYCDEIDGMPDDVAGEGDPITLAFKRAEGFAKSIKLLSGTGTFKPKRGEDGTPIYRSKVHQWFDQSDQQKWFCPCRRCGHWQYLRFEQVRVLENKTAEPAYYLCEKCDTDHTDRQRIVMVKAGEWRPTAPFHGIRGYWVNGVNSTLPAEKGFATKMHQFISDAEQAKKGKMSKRVWINTFLAELDDPDEQTEEPPSIHPLMKRLEPYATIKGITVPLGASLLTSASDVQQDRLEVLWTGWNRTEESWVLDRVVLGGSVHEDLVWRKLEQEFLRKFRREDGAPMELMFGLIDAGKWPDRVLAFLSRLRATGSPLHGKIRACRGSSQFPHPVIDTRYSRIIKQVHGHWIGGDAAKDLIYSRLRRSIPEDGVLPDAWQHFPETVDSNFFDQLTAERVSVTYLRGEEIRRYTNEDHLRNEILDMSVYNLAAFRLRKWPFDAIESELKSRAEELKGDRKEEPAKVVPVPFVRDFIHDW